MSDYTNGCLHTVRIVAAHNWWWRMRHVFCGRQSLEGILAGAAQLSECHHWPFATCTLEQLQQPEVIVPSVLDFPRHNEVFVAITIPVSESGPRRLASDSVKDKVAERVARVADSSELNVAADADSLKVEQLFVVNCADDVEVLVACGTAKGRRATGDGGFTLITPRGTHMHGAFIASLP